MRSSGAEVCAGAVVISLDPEHPRPSLKAQVQFTTATCGVHVSGTIYRMDETPLPLKSFLATDYPGDAEILGQIRAAMSEGTLLGPSISSR